MATKAKKATAPRGNATQSKTGAGPAVAARSKDARKTFGRAAPKTVKPAAARKTAANPTKTASTKPSKRSAKPSVAKRVVRKVAKTATGAVTGAVALAASVIGKSGKPAKARSK